MSDRSSPDDLKSSGRDPGHMSIKVTQAASRVSGHIRPRSVSGKPTVAAGFSSEYVGSVVGRTGPGLSVWFPIGLGREGPMTVLSVRIQGSYLLSPR